MRKASRYAICAVAGLLAQQALLFLFGLLLRAVSGSSTVPLAWGATAFIAGTLGSFVVAVTLNDTLRERYRPPEPPPARPLRERPREEKGVGGR